MNKVHATKYLCVVTRKKNLSSCLVILNLFFRNGSTTKK